MSLRKYFRCVNLHKFPNMSERKENLRIWYDSCQGLVRTRQYFSLGLSRDSKSNPMAREHVRPMILQVVELGFMAAVGPKLNTDHTSIWYLILASGPSSSIEL